jgi:hypothetical protein
MFENIKHNYKFYVQYVKNFLNELFIRSENQSFKRYNKACNILGSMIFSQENTCVKVYYISSINTKFFLDI